MKFEVVKTYEPQQMKDHLANSRTANQQVYDLLQNTAIDAGFTIKLPGDEEERKKAITSLRTYLSNKKKVINSSVQTDGEMVTITRLVPKAAA